MTQAGTLRFLLRMGLGTAAVIVVSAVVLIDHWQRQALLEPEIVTGWILLGAIVFLVLFNLRKKLPMVPLGRTSDWLAAHVAIGLATAAVYAVHARELWPSGYELALALLFYAVTLSGLLGYLLQRQVPRAVADIEHEVIWERIPAELAALRERAEAIVLECARETGSEVLPRLYREDLAWYFRKPRFVVASLVGDGVSASWLRHRFASVLPYLRGPELSYRDALRVCAKRKVDIDRAFALQGLLKVWLLVHVPATYGFLVLVVWHVILVHVYFA